MAKALELAARTENISVSEAVRNAIEKYIDIKREDSDFQKRLTELFEDEREVFEKLAKQ